MSAALALLAHHDDEFFLAPVLQDECAAGTELRVVFLTHGSRFGAETGVRARESQAALAGLGVDASRIMELGLEGGIFDGELMHKAGAALEALTAHLDGQRFERIYLMGWEGGHTDHDAAHLIGRAYAERTQPAARRLEFPLYNCFGMEPGKFRVMRLAPGPGPILERRVTAAEMEACLGLFDSYASQRQVLAALRPGVEQMLRQRGSYRYRELAAGRDYSQPPHPGALFYEQRFGVSFAAFRAALASQGL
jgi:LmbE family N-acetylglucosaminyl deacetylase